MDFLKSGSPFLLKSSRNDTFCKLRPEIVIPVRKMANFFNRKFMSFTNKYDEPIKLIKNGDNFTNSLKDKANGLARIPNKYS